MSRASLAVPGGLYAILDESIVGSGDWAGSTRDLLSGGARVIQLRTKTLEAGDMLEAAKAVIEKCRAVNAVFIVNDRADVALIAGADGVHVGDEDIPVKECRKLLGDKAIIGASTHSKEDALEAARSGADYIGYGPIYQTGTKQSSRAPRGIEALAEIVKSVSIPVIAIGGIDPDNVAAVKKAGATGAAVIGALGASGDIEAGANAMINAWEVA